MTAARKSQRWLWLAAVMSEVLVGSSCGAGAVTRADALRPEEFELSTVNGQSVPVPAYPLPSAGWVWIKSARIKSTIVGRALDPRIFENRSGQGTSGGSSRDSTTAFELVADIREFEERNGNTSRSAVLATYTDTSAATIERRDDLLIITRDGPLPRLVMVDTAHFVDDKLTVTVKEWERFSLQLRSANALFVYTITNK